MKQSSSIQSYSSLVYQSGPIPVSEYINDIPNKIHQQLYKIALDRFLEDNPQYKENTKIIEFKNKEYWMPSYIRIIGMGLKDRTVTTYYLDQYWENVYIDKDNILYTIDDINNIKDDISEVDYIDYIQGNATMKTKYSGDSFKVKFDVLSGDTPVTDSFDVYKETFTYLNRSGQ